MEHTAMRRLLTKALMLAGAIALTTPVWAQGSPAWTRAEVRKVDVDNGKITLKHEEIRNMEMPPMTMVFRVSSPALLEGIKPGDAVLFIAERRDGAMVVTDLKAAAEPPRPAAKPGP